MSLGIHNYINTLHLLLNDLLLYGLQALLLGRSVGLPLVGDYSFTRIWMKKGAEISANANTPDITKGAFVFIGKSCIITFIKHICVR